MQLQRSANTAQALLVACTLITRRRNSFFRGTTKQIGRSGSGAKKNETIIKSDGLRGCDVLPEFLLSYFFSVRGYFCTSKKNQRG
jgi:hypothetical protein